MPQRTSFIPFFPLYPNPKSLFLFFFFLRPSDSISEFKIQNSKIKISSEVEDFSNMVKSVDGGGGSSSIAPFLRKCYDMVDDSSTDSIISWSPSADNSFVILDTTVFSVQLLPQYFKHSNISSFIRQLNIYVSLFASHSSILSCWVSLVLLNCLFDVSTVVVLSKVTSFLCFLSCFDCF